MQKVDEKKCGDALKNSICFDVKDGVVRQMRYCEKAKDYFFDNPCRNCPNKKRYRR